MALANPETDNSSADLVEAVSKDSSSIPKQVVEQGGLRQPDMRFASILSKRTAPAKIKGGDIFEPKYWSLSQSSFNISESPQVRVRERTDERIHTQPQSQANAHAQAPSPITVRQGSKGSAIQDKSQPQPQSSPEPLAAAYTFVGRMIDGKEVSLFLIKNDRTYVVKVNDVLDNTYRVDKITNVDATLTYLPNNTQQTLTFNSTTVGSSALVDEPDVADSSLASLPVVPQPPQGTNQPIQQPIREHAPEGSLGLPAVSATAP